jgi:metallophosphoesterase superfamily enzyme
MSESKCVVVSDVHLGIEYSNREKFTDFIENLESDTIYSILFWCHVRS